MALSGTGARTTRKAFACIIYKYINERFHAIHIYIYIFKQKLEKHINIEKN